MVVPLSQVMSNIEGLRQSNVDFWFGPFLLICSIAHLSSLGGIPAEGKVKGKGFEPTQVGLS